MFSVQLAVCQVHWLPSLTQSFNQVVKIRGSDLKRFKLKCTGSTTGVGHNGLSTSILSRTFFLWCFATSAEVRALFMWVDLVERSGEVVGLLYSVRLCESSN